jgi:hypothetical protein
MNSRQTSQTEPAMGFRVSHFQMTHFQVHQG